MTIGFIFPGQGSQKVGMGRDWAEASEAARAAFEEADDVLGFSLSRLCWEGPEEDLQLTANTQPAILTCSVAMHPGDRRPRAGAGGDGRPQSRRVLRPGGGRRPRLRHRPQAWCDSAAN